MNCRWIVLSAVILGLLACSDAAKQTKNRARFTIGGAITGLGGSGLLLNDHGKDVSFIIRSDGSFELDTTYAAGDEYDISIAAQPQSPRQHCAIANNLGNVAGANVDDIKIVCENAYTVGGQVIGLQAGEKLGLKLKIYRTNIVTGEQQSSDESISVGSGPYRFEALTLQGRPLEISLDVSEAGDKVCLIDGVLPETVEQDIDTVQIVCAFEFNKVAVGEVTPLYAAAPDWNDYVQPSGEACVGDEADLNACFHAGDKRELIISLENSCEGAVISDQLGKFRWQCVEEGGTIHIRSEGLVPGAGLRDLIDFTTVTPAWRDNSVKVRKGNTIYDSQAGAWWGNAFLTYPAAQLLDQTDVIYVVTENQQSAHIPLQASGAALVTAPGIVIKGNGVVDEGAVFTVNVRYVWVEANIVNNGENAGINLVNTTFSIVHGVSMTNNYPDPVFSAKGVYLQNSANIIVRQSSIEKSEHAVYIENSKNNAISDNHFTRNARSVVNLQSSDRNRFFNNTVVDDGAISVTGGIGNHFSDFDMVRSGGISLTGADANVFKNITIAEGGKGIGVDSGSGNHFDRVRLINNASAFYLINATGNSFTNILMHANARIGRMDSHCENNVFVNITAANNNGGWSVEFNNANNYFGNIALINNSSGFTLDGANVNLLENVVIAASGGTGLHHLRTQGNLLRDVRLISNTTQCAIDAAVDPAFTVDVDGNCLVGGVPINVDDAGLLDSLVLGPLSANDSVNATFAIAGFNDNGSAPYDQISDWSRFENPHRAWGLDSTGNIPDPQSLGPCQSGNCRIWDFQLSVNSSLLNTVNRLPGLKQHRWAAADENICISQSGQWLLKQGSTVDYECVVNYMPLAQEIIDDGIGNDNGLCEGGETCLYATNSGVYQGHGDTEALTGLDGIHLIRYLSNGI